MSKEKRLSEMCELYAAEISVDPTLVDLFRKIIYFKTTSDSSEEHGFFIENEMKKFNYECDFNAPDIKIRNRCVCGVRIINEHFIRKENLLLTMGSCCIKKWSITTIHLCFFCNQGKPIDYLKNKNFCKNCDYANMETIIFEGSYKNCTYGRIIEEAFSLNRVNALTDFLGRFKIYIETLPKTQILKYKKIIIILESLLNRKLLEQ